MIRSPFPATPHVLVRRGKSHSTALRQVSNRLVGILHGCLESGACYDEHTAWGHRYGEPEPAAA